MDEPQIDEILNGPISHLHSEEAVLLRAMIGQLREVNGRLARAEAMTAALMSGKSAKWLALFAKGTGH